MMAAKKTAGTRPDTPKSTTAEIGYVHVVAYLDVDATARTEGRKGFAVDMYLRVPYRDHVHKLPASFVYPGNRADDLHDLISRLKKDRSVELVSFLDTGATTLFARYVRIDRIDYQLAPDVQLLPEKTP